MIPYTTGRSMSIDDFLCRSPEETDNINFVQFASDDAWSRTMKFRKAGDDYLGVDMNLEERFMFLCFVLLAEGEEL